MEFLIVLCASIDRDFEELYDVVSRSTDYAVDVRYPEFYIPSVEKARNALEPTTRVKCFVQEYGSDEFRRERLEGNEGKA